MVGHYIKALNAADLTAISELFAETVVAFDPVGTQRIDGHAALLKFFETGPFTHPIRAELDGQVRLAGNSAAFAFVAYSDNAEMHIIDVFEFGDDNKITKMLAYWSNANVVSSR
ncbi:MAG: nuclear transport factor 2 family protein [Pseudomonadota bacterium]